MSQDIAQNEPEVSRERLVEIERAMTQMPQGHFPVTHHFAPGLYAREVFIPAGSLVTGKIHKYGQLNILSAGRVSLLVDGFWRDLCAPFTIVSPPGTKRMLYAHEDTVWTTIHATDETDLDIIEAKFIAQDETEYLEFCRQAKLGDTKWLG